MEKKDFAVIESLVKEYYETVKKRPKTTTFINREAKPSIHYFNIILDDITIYNNNCVLKARISKNYNSENIYYNTELQQAYFSNHFSSSKAFKTYSENCVKEMQILETCGIIEYVEEIKQFNETVMSPLKQKFINEFKRLIENKTIKTICRNGKYYLNIKQDLARDLFPNFEQHYDYKRDGSLDEIYLDLAKSSLYWYRKEV